MLILSWTDKKTGEWRYVRFDVVTSESHEAVMSITAHPVEQGSDIVDHARPEPRRITIEGYVSNKPLMSNPGVEGVASFQSVDLGIQQQPSSPLDRDVFARLTPSAASRATVLKADGDFPDRARAVVDTLQQVRLDRAFVRVVSKLGDIDSLLIERVAVPRTPEDGDGLTIQIDLLWVRIVRSETVRAPLPAEARGAALVSKGSKAAQKSDNDAKKQLKSVLAGTFDAGANMLSSLLP
jgi:hypothetical protein